MATVENFSLRDLYSRTSGNLTSTGTSLTNADLLFITVGTGTANVSSIAVTLGEHVSYLNSNSNLQSVYTTLTANSGSWGSVYTTVNSNSGNWGSVYTTVNGKSANWDSAYSNIPSGTTTKVPKFTSSNQLGDSSITENALGYTEFANSISASDTGDSIVAAGDIVAFGTSDQRLKDNVVPIKNPLEKLSKLDGVTFTWNLSSHRNGTEDVGVIAQQVQEVLPQIVTTRETGVLAVAYDKMIPLLIESIKELQKKVEELEKRCQ